MKTPVAVMVIRMNRLRRRHRIAHLRALILNGGMNAADPPRQQPAACAEKPASPSAPRLRPVPPGGRRNQRFNFHHPREAIRRGTGQTQQAA